jgi:hypothetical protein
MESVLAGRMDVSLAPDSGRAVSGFVGAGTLEARRAGQAPPLQRFW